MNLIAFTTIKTSIDCKIKLLKNLMTISFHDRVFLSGFHVS